MMFSGIQKTSLIDYPDRIATTLFVPGCNLRCPFCHNWRLVIDHPPPCLSPDTVLDILEARRRFVDAVVITGGEPTIHPRLPDFVRTLNDRGFSVKVDSNGIMPDALRQCLPDLDYVAIDVKTSPQLYQELGNGGAWELSETLNLVKRQGADYEFRCTAVPGFVTEKTVLEMGKMVEGAKRFAFQQFMPGDTLDPSFKDLEPYPADRIQRLADIMSAYVDEVVLRL